MRPATALFGGTRTTAGMCLAIPWSPAVGPIVGKSCANIIWHRRFGCCAIFRGRCASLSETSLATDGLACGRLPALHLLIALCIAVKRAFEISQGDDKAGRAVDKSDLEYVVLQE